MNSCSIIIIAFDDAELTSLSVDAVLQTVAPDVEIILVCPATATPPTHSRVQVIRHPTRNSRAEACNQGARTAHGECLAFLDSGTIVQPGWMDSLTDYGSCHPRAAVIGSKLLDMCGDVLHAGLLIAQDRYPRPIYAGFPGDHPAVNQARPFQAVNTACALIRRNPFQQAGGFDCTFSNGFEDVDLCLRLGELGHETHYCPASVAIRFDSGPESVESNSDVEMYRRRWYERLQTDDLPFYLAEGLLRFTDNTQYLPGPGKSGQQEYSKLRRRIVETVWRVVPAGASVLVASKGDSRLLRIHGCTAGHFPQSETAVYSGYHFPDSAALLEQLDLLRNRGAQYLVLPETAYWWLDFYRGFHTYLSTACSRIGEPGGSCMIFRLPESDAPPNGVRANLSRAGASSTDAKQVDPSLPSQICNLAKLSIPAGSSVLLAGLDDRPLPEFEAYRALPFPAPSTSTKPFVDSADAISQVETLRREKAEYVVFPVTVFWWLDLYADFRRYLETTALLVAHGESCVIYSLSPLVWTRPKQPKRVIAIVAARNEERFIEACLEHYIRQGVEVYLIDNGSTDLTVPIAQRYLGRGLIEIEDLPFGGVFSQNQIDRRKEQVAAGLDADWFIYSDADEFRFSPHPGLSLAEGLAVAESAGYNAVNFLEFVFIPTEESPCHDHERFQETMTSYYLFLQHCPFRINAWQRQSGPLQLNPHRVLFSGMRLCPDSFVMKHYQFLSVDHAVEKYGPRRHDPAELRSGMHGGFKNWREQYNGWSFPLPRMSWLKQFRGDGQWDASAPWARHYLEDTLEANR
jgi:GT2 family glycosyltransferase